MRITEKTLRKITRKVLQELFTKKNKASIAGFLSRDNIDVHSYGGDGDGGAFGESEEKLEEEELEEEELEEEGQKGFLPGPG